MTARIVCFIVFLACTNVHAEAHDNVLKGRVTSQDKALANVQVTDGTICVLTDDDGYYTIPSFGEEGFVYITIPSGYHTKVKDSTIPQFYQKIEKGKSNYDFELIRNDEDDTHHVFFVQTDVQVTQPKDLNVGYKRVINDLNSEKDKYTGIHQFSIDCGDIVGDSPLLFPLYIETAKSIDLAIFRSIGNHDMDYYGRTHETSDRTFSNYFGPTHYSFNKGNAHYIVINNNFFIGRDYFYMGYINEKTFNWLEQDLSHIQDSNLVFLVMHIPARLTNKKEPFQYNYDLIADQTVNAQALFNLLKPYNTHIISGHMHYNLNIEHDHNIFEHNTASVCGTWWLGDICLDGTPQGYGVYEVNGNNVSWYYKGVGYPTDYQMRVYPVGSSSEHPGQVIANVWNWDSAWKVEWLEDGILAGEMEHYTGYDPAAQQLCNDKEKITYDWIAAIPNKHMFKATPINSSAVIEIRVTDRFGKAYTQKIKR